MLTEGLTEGLTDEPTDGLAEALIECPNDGLANGGADAKVYGMWVWQKQRSDVADGLRCWH